MKAMVLQKIGPMEHHGEPLKFMDMPVPVPDDREVLVKVSACGVCHTGNENLCEQFEATGRDVHGGYAEFLKVPENFAHKIPERFSDSQAAPLLCAGAIGYRSLKLTGIQNGFNQALMELKKRKIRGAKVLLVE